MPTYGELTATDRALQRVRTARRAYWAARELGRPDEIEQALREWVEAQIAAADLELVPRGWVLDERPMPRERPTWDDR